MSRIDQLPDEAPPARRDRDRSTRRMEARGMNTATITPDLDVRITAAFADGANSDSIASLIGEVEAAAIAADEMAQRARSRALDPVLSASDVAIARREAEDALFKRD